MTSAGNEPNESAYISVFDCEARSFAASATVSLTSFGILCNVFCSILTSSAIFCCTGRGIGSYPLCSVFDGLMTSWQAFFTCSPEGILIYSLCESSSSFSKSSDHRQSHHRNHRQNLRFPLLSRICLIT